MNFKNKFIRKAVLLGIILLSIGCESYLDIVPDGTQELSLLFNRKETAYNALADSYSYLPKYDDTYASYVLASDEVAVPIDKETDAIKLMKGQQNTSSPLMGYWFGFSGGNTQGSLWEGIRSCNTLIDNIDLVVDMEQEEKEQWKAEVTFLKAYYHFLLLSNYGPIPIIDVNLPIDASDEAVRVDRKTLDECFAYIVTTIDNAIENLPERVLGNNDLGRIDQVIAKSIKAKVLLYSASPLFNGNSSFYGDFLNAEGQHFFNQTYDASKWELAANAAKEAIDASIAEGASLYYFPSGSAPAFDDENFQFQFINDQYNCRFSITEPWNSELLWGNSNPVRNGNWWQIQSPALMKNPASSSVEAAWQWLAPSLRMAETYYTKNGLPIEEDLSFEYADRYAVTTIAFNQRFYAQFANRTAKLNLDREPRFYATLGFDRGLNRTWGSLWNLKMRGGEVHGRVANTSDYLTTGYALKKLVHQDSEGDAYNKAITYPWPMMRLSELYLTYAEALNESTGPSTEVYDALNKIRERAGIPTVQDAWSDPAVAATPNKHTSKEGLREIIRQERMIELAFEGHRYYDIRRWKLAEQYFTSPIKGWSVDEESETNYYQIMEVGQRSFNSPRDYLQPISFTELSRNPNLIQNPGW